MRGGVKTTLVSCGMDYPEFNERDFLPQQGKGICYEVKV
jgi:hypothetical protein